MARKRTNRAQRAESKEELHRTTTPIHKQAKDRLRSIQKTPQVSVDELGTEIDRLTKLAYPYLDQQSRDDIAVDVFYGAMDNKRLQKLLLALSPRNIAEAVKYAEEFLEDAKEHRPTRIATTGSTTEEPEHSDKEDLYEFLQQFREDKLAERRAKRKEEIDRFLEEGQVVIREMRDLQTALIQNREDIDEQKRDLQRIQSNLDKIREEVIKYGEGTDNSNEAKQSENYYGPVQLVYQLN